MNRTTRKCETCDIPIVVDSAGNTSLCINCQDPEIVRARRIKKALRGLVEWVLDTHANECWLDTDNFDDEHIEGMWRSYEDLPVILEATEALEDEEDEE